jgi:DNA-directed RNA polymerase subunit RPC12/RpoP
MTTNDKALKARLMAQAEEAIDKLLAGRSEKQELQLSDIERLVRAAGWKVMEQFTQELVAEEGQREESCLCPECGRRARYKGHKGRELVTNTGDVHLERAYYRCPTCRQGFFPPRPALESERGGRKASECVQPGTGTADGMAEWSADL